MSIAPFTLSNANERRYAWWLALSGFRVFIDAGRVVIR